MRAPMSLVGLLLFSLAFVSGLGAGETNVFHSGFEDGDADLTDGSSGTATDSAWVSDGRKKGTDSVAGNDQGDVLVESYACKLVKHAGTDTLFAHADAGGDRDSLHVGLWLKMEDWDAYGVAPGHTTDIFSLWDQGLSTEAVRVMIAGDYQRSLLVEFRDGNDVVTLGTEELEYTSYGSDPIDVGAQEGSLYLDSGRWYYLELFYRSHATNGGVELRVDGGLRLYRYGANTSSRRAGALILGARPFEDTNSTMTFLFDDVDIGLFEGLWTGPDEIHKKTHPDHDTAAGIPLVVDFNSTQGSFAGNFQRRFLQMNAEVETDALYDIIVSSNTATGYTYPKYQAMGIEGVRFVATGFECAFGNPQVTGKPGGTGTYATFAFDFGRLEDLIAGVSDSIGASLRIGLGKTNVAMQCLEGFEYPGTASMESVWAVTDTSALSISLTTANPYERAKALKITVESAVDPSDAVSRTVTDTPDSNWLIASAQTKTFDLWLAAGESGLKATFFVVSGTDTAYWGEQSIPTSYKQVTLDLTAPDRTTGGWTLSRLAHVDSFGLIDLHSTAGHYPAHYVVDWLRLPRTGWYPYDGSLMSVRLDWWKQYCDEAIESIKTTLGADTLGLVIEGWNESDRWYTTTGDPARLQDVLDLYRVTAESFEEHFPSGGPQMASLGITDPKESGFIGSFLDMVTDSSLAMDLFTTHTYKGSPNTVVEVMETSRAVLDSNGFEDTPIYNSAYMDYFTQDFRKDTNHRAAQWLMTMLKLEEANRVDGLNVWGVTTYGYKDFNEKEGCAHLVPNADRRYQGGFGLLTNVNYWGAIPKSWSYAYELASMMDTLQVAVVDSTGGAHPERQYWVKGIATKAGTYPPGSDRLSVLLVNFDNALAVGDANLVPESVNLICRNLPWTNTTVSWTKYLVDRDHANPCYDGGWGEVASTSPHVVRDTTGTKYWTPHVMQNQDLRFVDAGNNEYTISDNGANTITLQETSPALEPGIYHIENLAAADTLAVVEQTTVAVDGTGRLEKTIAMPLNSVVLVRITGE